MEMCKCKWNQTKKRNETQTMTKSIPVLYIFMIAWIYYFDGKCSALQMTCREIDSGIAAYAVIFHIRKSWLFSMMQIVTIFLKIKLKTSTFQWNVSLFIWSAFSLPLLHIYLYEYECVYKCHNFVFLLFIAKFVAERIVPWMTYAVSIYQVQRKEISNIKQTHLHTCNSPYIFMSTGRECCK